MLNNNPVIDTTKFEFGRYYKFDIPATVKTTTPDGVDIVNTANQVVHQYDPTKKTVTTPPKKDTQKRVVNLPISLPLNFTKRLDGRQLQANEFTFNSERVALRLLMPKMMHQMLMVLPRLTLKHFSSPMMILEKLILIQ